MDAKDDSGLVALLGVIRAFTVKGRRAGAVGNPAFRRHDGAVPDKLGNRAQPC